MIMIKLGAGLGNNMFQYAAARTLAEKKGYDFCYFPVRGFAFYWKRLRGIFLRFITLHKTKTYPKKQIVQSDISKYFTLGNDNLLKRYFQRILWIFTPRSRKKEFAPTRKLHDDRHSFEIFDPSIFQVSDYTRLRGGYASQAYFLDNRDRVLEWYTLHKSYRKILEKLEQSILEPPERRCCIHVRSGDFSFTDKGLAYGNTGWTLPAAEFTSTNTAGQSEGDGLWYLHVQAKDEAGNISGVVTVSVLLDNTVPTATVSYDPSGSTPTNQDVVATITLSDGTVTSEGGYTHTFTGNGSFTFEFRDSVGNTGSATVTVDWIDKTAPTASVSFWA